MRLIIVAMDLLIMVTAEVSYLMAGFEGGDGIFEGEAFGM